MHLLDWHHLRRTGVLYSPIHLVRISSNIIDVSIYISLCKRFMLYPFFVTFNRIEVTDYGVFSENSSIYGKFHLNSS